MCFELLELIKFYGDDELGNNYFQYFICWSGYKSYLK